MAIDLSKPQYDQDYYIGRAKHFFKLTNPFNLLASNEELEDAKSVVETFKKSGRMPAEHDESKLWQKKYLYDSAFHPDTGEKMFLPFRMAAQAPMNALITGCMITFYKTNAQSMFWQWINQTFNAGVNYTNRSGKAPVSKTRLLASYICACTGALGTAVYLNNKAKSMNPMFARLVPFAAVCGANCINIPMMRSAELSNGATCFTKDGVQVGESVRAAIIGITSVVISRIFMAVPSMTMTPMIVERLHRRNFFCFYPRAEFPLQLFLVGVFVSIATPLCCAIFKQRASIGVNSLESELAEKVKKSYPKETAVYFNKGL